MIDHTHTLMCEPSLSQQLRAPSRDPTRWSRATRLIPLYQRGAYLRHPPRGAISRHPLFLSAASRPEGHEGLSSRALMREVLLSAGGGLDRRARDSRVCTVAFLVPAVRGPIW